MRKLITQSELINEEIRRLNEKGGKDWQRLFNQVDGNYTTLRYNLAQMVASESIKTHKTVINLWGRGTGKTTSIGDTIRQMVQSMPRAVGAFVSPSNMFFMTRIIPSLVQGLELQGLYQNLHYFIGKRPPRAWNWPVPYQPPSKYDNFVSFYNGFGFHLVSQDRTGDGRGLNVDFIITDESALLDKGKLEENIEPALRGSNRKAFEKSPFLGLTVHHTSMPISSKGQWIFDIEQAQMESPDTIKVIMANCLCNLQNLMPGYLEERKKTTTPWIFESEYLNKRPNKVDSAFYAMMSEDKHGYTNFDNSYYNSLGKKVDVRGDADVVKDKPLIIGIDWGAVINSLVVLQNLPGEVRALNSMYVLSDRGETQDDLADRLTSYYDHHPTKTMYMYYDNTGNNRTGNTTRTRAEQFAAKLKAKGWNVIQRTEGGANPKHGEKHMIWESILKEDATWLPKFRINTINARDLLVSMQNTRVLVGSDGTIKKDKSSERKLRTTDRQKATDLSDAIDTVIHGLFSDIHRRHGGWNYQLPDSYVR